MTEIVLLVDDDRILLRRIERYCHRHAGRFTLILAENGKDAVRVLRQKDVSLVVSDLVMPEMDGFALLAHMSENFPDIPVIVQTGFGSTETTRAALERGAVGYIEKPVTPEALERKILDALDEKRAGDAVRYVPLELFCRLLEMEGKTCTLRVHRHENAPAGILFFHGGQLVNARVEALQGLAAAQQILEWKDATYHIQDVCADCDAVIEGGLDVVLGSVY